MTDYSAVANAVMRRRTLAEGLFDELVRLSRDATAGVTRASYSDEENRIHDSFATTAATLGLAVERDAAANTYMTRAGRDRTAKQIVIGSHLDSVKQGCHFDGTARVVAGLMACAAPQRLGLPPRVNCAVVV